MGVVAGKGLEVTGEEGDQRQLVSRRDGDLRGGLGGVALDLSGGGPPRPRRSRALSGKSTVRAWRLVAPSTTTVIGAVRAIRRPGGNTVRIPTSSTTSSGLTPLLLTSHQTPASASREPATLEIPGRTDRGRGRALRAAERKGVALNNLKLLVAEPDRQAGPSVCHNRQGTTGLARRRCTARRLGALGAQYEGRRPHRSGGIGADLDGLYAKTGDKPSKATAGSATPVC